MAYDKRFPMPLQGKDKEWCVSIARMCHTIRMICVVLLCTHAANVGHQASCLISGEVLLVVQSYFCCCLYVCRNAEV